MKGLIRRADNGAPIVNAGVSIHTGSDTSGVRGPLLASARTDASGHFTASFLRPGFYWVVAEDFARQVESESKKVEVKAGQTTDVGEIAF